MVSQPDSSRSEERNATSSEARQSIGSQARDGIAREIEGRQQQVESRLESMAQSMHDAVELFHDEDEQMLARCMDYAAGQLDSVAKYLKDRSFRGMRDDAAGLVRDHSLAFLGAAFVGGILAGRFFRSSNHRELISQPLGLMDSHSHSQSPLKGGLESVASPRPAWTGGVPGMPTSPSTQGPPPGQHSTGALS